MIVSGLLSIHGRSGRGRGFRSLAPTYFCHEFARVFNLSPMRYIVRRRVEQAMRRLWSTDEPLKDVAR